MLFGYWVYLKYSPLEAFGLIIKESAITDPGAGISIPSSLRFTLLYYSEIMFSIIFGIISIIALIIMKTKRKASDVSLFLFSGFMGILMVITLFGALLKSESMGLGSRLQTFVYIGLFLLSGYFFAETSNYKLQFNKRNIKNRLIKILPILLIIFLMLNIYRIPPYLYSDYQFSSTEPRSVISGQEFTALIWLGVSGDKLISDKNLRGAIKYSQYLSTQIPHTVILIQLIYSIIPLCLLIQRVE